MLGEGRPGDAGPLAGYLGEAQRKVEQFAERLSARGPQGVLDDLGGFARRKPAMFLLVAAGAGFAVGRMTRSGVATHKEPSPSDSAALPPASPTPSSPTMQSGMPTTSTELPPPIGAVS